LLLFHLIIAQNQVILLSVKYIYYTVVKDIRRCLVFDGKKIVSLADLDKLVALMRKGNGSMGIAMKHFNELDQPQQMYVGLAANKMALLSGNRVVYAFNRIGTIWQKEFIARHQYN